MEAALGPARQPWTPTRGGLEGRLTVSSSSFPKRKLFLILAAVETAYINIISTSPTSSFSFLKNMFHDQTPCPVCVWSWLITRGGDTRSLPHTMKGQCVLNCHHPPWTSLCPLSCLEPKTLWKDPVLLRADAGDRTGAGRSG